MGKFNGVSLLVSLWSILLDRTFADVIFDSKTCGANAATQGAAWLTDVTNMATTAWTLMDTTGRNSAQPWDKYRTMATYNSLFDELHPDSANRWQSVKDGMATMKTISTNSLKIYVLCDDAPYFTTNSAGTIVFTNPATQKQTPYPGWSNCATATNPMYGYSFPNAGINFIVLCSVQMPAPNVLSDLRTAASGEYLFSKETWSARLFHELTHAAIPGLLAGDTAEKYGWYNAMSIRSSSGPQNPDSLKLFAQILTMNSMLWDSGQAQTFEDRWTYLNLAPTPGGRRTVQRFGLFDPIFMLTPP